MISVETAQQVFEKQKANFVLSKEAIEAGLEIMKDYPFGKYVIWDQPVIYDFGQAPVNIHPDPRIIMYPAPIKAVYGVLRHEGCLVAMAMPGYLYIIFEDQVYSERSYIRYGWVPIDQVVKYEQV